MIQMTQSFSHWCCKYHSEIYSLIMFGHAEEMTKELWEEYYDWCRTEEGKQYLKGGSKHHGEN